MRRFPVWAKTLARRVGPRLRVRDRLASSFHIRNPALLGWFGVGLIVILSLVPGSNRPASGMPSQLEHVAAYLLCSILLLGACAPGETGARFLFLCGLATMLETLQLFIPGRTYRLIDLSSSIAGVAFGFLLVAIGSRERRLISAPAQGSMLAPAPHGGAEAVDSGSSLGSGLLEWSYRRGWTDRIVDSSPDLLTVLAYHRITDINARDFCGFKPNVSASPDEFERQIAYICRHSSPISVGDLECWLDGGPRLPKRPVLVTFDDGYADNADVAWPILRTKQVPAVVFLATEHIGTGRAFLWDLVALAIESTRKSIAALPLLGEIVLSSARERNLATKLWVEQSKALPPLQRWLALRALLETLDVNIDESAFGALYLSWDEVRRLASEGLDFGGHTLTHPILTKSSYLDARREIEGSRSKIASILGRAPCAFAYPNGSAKDFNPEHEKLVHDAGYAMAFSLKPGPMTFIGARFRRMAIRRIYIGQDDDMGRFAAKLAGAARARQSSRAIYDTARGLIAGNFASKHFTGPRLGHAVTASRS
jgi:peptidoglycan/xylan/chitin deacetylase (PgdA/CDA1 family)/VanZ family protein